MPDPVTEFEEYRAELLGLLGAQEPVPVLRNTLEQVIQLTEAASEEELNRQPRQGEWSPRQVLSHLADAELMVNVRVRMIVTQDKPQLVGYDQDAWTSRFADLYTAKETLERFKLLRATNLKMFESLTRQEWERVGLHTERGPESALLTVQLEAGHDRMHLDQIRRGMPGA